jgi:hypothetical protein
MVLCGLLLLVGIVSVLFMESTSRSTRVTELAVSRILPGGRVELRCRRPEGHAAGLPVHARAALVPRRP